MKRLASFLIVSMFLVAIVVPAQAEIKIGEYEDVALYTEIHTVGTFQALSFDNSMGNAAEQRPGIQTAWGNMDWRITRDDHWEMFFDVTMANRTHTDRWWGHQGYIRLNKLPESSPVSFVNPVLNYVDLKAGHFTLNYGDQVWRRSINADVQRNPLIGNYIVTPEATEPGLEIYSAQGPVNWVVGTGMGSSTADFNDDAAPSWHAKVWGNPIPDLRLAGSYYRLDSSDVNPGAYGGPGHLFGSERSTGSRFNIPGDNNFTGLITPGNGVDVTSYQFDVGWDVTPRTFVHAHYGYMEDADQNGDSTVVSGDNVSPAEEWNYYGADVTHDLTKDGDVYLAARYNVADADKLETTTSSVSDPGEATMWEAGVGAYLTKRMLLKATYVDAEAENLGSYSDEMSSQEFSGAMAEMSVTF